MAVDNSGLPDGFVIDEPSTADNSGLPEGFVIDSKSNTADVSSPAPEVSKTQSQVNDVASNIRQSIGNLALKTNPISLAVEAVDGNLLKKDPLAGATGDMLDGVLQSATFGIPKAITKKILEANNLTYPEPKDKVAENIGKVIGLLAPTAVSENITARISGFAGKTLAADMARGASTGAMVGFSTSPDDFMDISQRIKQAGLGATLGAVIPAAAQGIQALSKAAFKASELAQEVRASLFQAKTSIGKQFEGQLDNLITANPSKVISLEDTFTNLKTAANDNSRLISDLKLGAKRAGLDPKVVQGFIDNPSTASQMTLNQTRELKQAVSNIPGIKANYAKGKFANYSDTHIDLLDFADEIKKSQLGAFPELSGINKAYSEKITQYNMIKDKFKVGRLLNNMANNFGDPEIQKIVNGLLSQETIKKIGGYKTATKILDLAGKAATAGITGLTFGKAAGIFH